MTVAAEAAHADVAAVDDHVRTGVAEHEHAGVGKCPRGGRRRIRRQVLKLPLPVGSEEPERFVGERARPRLEIPTREHHGRGREPVAVIVDPLGAEDLHAPIVGITDEGRQAIRFGVGGDEVAHFFETGPGLRAGVDAAALQQQVAGGERLQHQSVIGGRLFEVDAVRRHLIEDLRDDDVAADLLPASAAGGGNEERAEKHQADAVAQVVVAVHRAALEMRGDELAVEVQRPQKGGAKLA